MTNFQSGVPDDEARARINAIAFEHLDAVAQRFRDYKRELGVEEWAPGNVGEIQQFVMCFLPMIEPLVHAHLEWGMPSERVPAAVWACIVTMVEAERFDNSRGPEYPPKPLMPVTYPWGPSTVFQKEGFKEAMENAVSESAKCMSNTEIPNEPGEVTIKAPWFVYKYPDDFPDDEQITIESARGEANRQLESKRVVSFDQHGAARTEWFWTVTSAAGAAIARAGAKLGWGANRRRRMLGDFGLKAAQVIQIAGANGQVFYDKICQSEKWRDLDGVLLDASVAEQPTITETQREEGERSQGSSVRDGSTEPPFRQGAKDHPYLNALWTAATKLWTLYDFVTDAQGKPNFDQTVPAGDRSTDLLKQAAKIAVCRLRYSSDEQVREVVKTLREPVIVWLDLMRANQRGFGLMPQLRSWRGGKAIEQFQETGTPPADARITGNGTIMELFKQSAAFWDDLASLGFISAQAASGATPRYPTQSINQSDSSTGFEDLGFTQVEPASSAKTDLIPNDANVNLLERIIKKKQITLEGWASGHNFGRTTVFDWKAGRSAGTSLKGKVSEDKAAEIESAIKADADELGLHSD